MHSPPQAEVEELFQRVRPNWRAEASLLPNSTPDPNDFDWFVKLYDEGNHYAGDARLRFEDNPARLEFVGLSLMPAYQKTGVFTRLYPLLGPWLTRWGFDWIIVREWIDPNPFTKRGFILRDDPTGIDQVRQVLAIDLRNPNRPSKKWVDNPADADPA